MKYFGTDGFRGRANEDLTVDHAFEIGRYIGWYYGARLDRKARIVVGKDTRRSSYMFEYAIVAGLVASGADAYLLHVTTTPSVSYVVIDGGFDCGVMITASHNPFTDNGIKLVNREGYKMEPEVLEKVESYLDGEVDVPLATGDAIGRTVDHVAGRERYINHLISCADFSLDGMRVGVDCANGASWTVAERVLTSLGAEVHVINDTPNGFNINVNCGSTHIEALQDHVRGNLLDVGFAFDGDADRCIAVDEAGNVIDGDFVLYICGRYLDDEGRLPHDTVVSTVMTNLGIVRALEDAGLHTVQTDVGDKNVYACMRENGYVLGGEQSGHVIFSDYEVTGDGVMTALRLLEVMVKTGKTLGQLSEPITLYPQVLENVTVADKAAAMAAPEVLAAVAAAEEALAEEGRVLVRASGTEPLVRVLVEAKTMEQCQTNSAAIAEVVRSLS
ncbi:MAG: phosphoglucosamine mutase [Atopobiaceae bacterium]|jgi:phosphoglucosamine mutase|nr:phosphoglucosamine mutase [Atopobiaceae bacterium]MCI2173431.1 phosphoglucosamine mutase [Atopobiaceae bacterium]MCI2207426.1 phosphoglucosamine mutase [Atopobiaceae bacterium]